MPPGFATQCWYGLGFFLPIWPWLTPLWLAVYALCVETALLGLGIVVARLRRAAPRGAAVSLLCVTGCAVAALAVAWWMTNRDYQASCVEFPFAPHLNAALAALAERVYAQLLAQGRICLGAAAALVALATTLTVLTLVRCWRGGRDSGRVVAATRRR